MTDPQFYPATRIDDLRTEVSKRIDDLRSEVASRLDSLEGRLDRMQR
jgi:hypothetical protein